MTTRPPGRRGGGGRGPGRGGGPVGPSTQGSGGRGWFLMLVLALVCVAAALIGKNR